MQNARELSQHKTSPSAHRVVVWLFTWAQLGAVNTQPLPGPSFWPGPAVPLYVLLR